MTIRSAAFGVSALLFGLSSGALAQDLGSPALNLSLCTPFLEGVEQETEENSDDLMESSLTRLYDKEKRETLSSEEDVMEALYEEKWDLATGEPQPRNDLCPGVPNYIIHWADLITRNDAGETELLAQGAFSFRKDGTFEFVFDRRSYSGTWSFADSAMTLTASWMNDGQAITAPVEKVQTPVQVLLSDGTTDTYFEEGYRVGWIRFLRSETTERGHFKDCPCTN
jgi:hypothetical protein